VELIRNTAEWSIHSATHNQHQCGQQHHSERNCGTDPQHGRMEHSQCHT